jgi:hypothetical protein
MPGAANLACGVGGLFAGMLLWVLVWRGIALAYTTSHSKRPLIWFTPLVVLLHPAMWMLVGIVYVVYRVSTRPMAPGWTWLVGGVFAGLALQALLLAWAWRRVRTKRATGSQAP